MSRNGSKEVAANATLPALRDQAADHLSKPDFSGGSIASMILTDGPSHISEARYALPTLEEEIEILLAGLQWHQQQVIQQDVVNSDYGGQLDRFVLHRFFVS
jgi:hypothetical protein